MAVALGVLLVEDEPSHAAAIRAELARGDYALTCECVSTPAAFAQALQQGGWSVILCDFLLPGFNGNDALALAQQAGSTAPFIIVSGQLDADAAVAAMRAGATYLTLNGALLDAERTDLFTLIDSVGAEARFAASLASL